MFTNLKISKDGEEYCVLFGESLAVGVAGFGKTEEEAMTDFCRNFLNSLKHSGQEYNFRVTTKESGQRARYGDSYYEFEIENLSPTNYNENFVKHFCTSYVKPAMSEEERQGLINKGNQGANFATYWTHFEKVSDRKFIYKAISPSTH